MLDATERKALTLSAFASACICFAPGEIISGTLLLLASGVLWRWDERVTRREAAYEAARSAVVAAPSAPSEGESSAEPPAATAQ